MRRKAGGGERELEVMSCFCPSGTRLIPLKEEGGEDREALGEAERGWR